jgi:hypothetical protein
MSIERSESVLDWCSGTLDCHGCKLQDYGMHLASEQIWSPNIPLREVEKAKESLRYWQGRHHRRYLNK